MWIRSASLILASAVAALALSACRLAPLTPAPSPPPSETYTIEQLTFRNPALGFRFRHLDACARQFAEEKALDYLPYYRASEGAPYSSLMASWCHKTEFGWCRATYGAPAAQPFRRVDLSGLFPTRRFDDIFSIGFKAVYAPAGSGWVAEMDMAIGESAGDGCVRLSYFDAGANTSAPAMPSRTLGLLCHATYALPDWRGDRIVRGEASALTNLTAGHRLARLLESPESLRDLGIQQYEDLLAQAQALLDSGDLLVCENTPATPQAGAGQRVAPAPTALPCIPRPLSPQEHQAESERLRAYISQRIEWLRADYAAMHAALEEAFPFAACWLSE